MHGFRSILSSSALIFLVGISSCVTETDGGRPVSSRIAFAQAWAAAINDIGKFPILPPTEDV